MSNLEQWNLSAGGERGLVQDERLPLASAIGRAAGTFSETHHLLKSLEMTGPELARLAYSALRDAIDIRNFQSGQPAYAHKQLEVKPI